MTRARPAAGIAFVFITVVLDMLAFGLALPVLPPLVSEMAGGDDAHGALVYGAFATIWAGLQFVCSPVLGAISDRVGRRPVLLFSNFGLALQYVVLALAPSLAWLLVGRIISGIASASVSTANAYVADVTPPDRRAAAFGMLGAAFGTGFVLGPAVGGVLGGIDPRLAFWAAACMSGVAGLYGLFFLPESLAEDRRAPIDWRRANPLGALAFLRDRRSVTPLAAAKFLWDLAHVVLPATFVLFAQHRFGWGPTQVGLTLGLVGVSTIIVQGFLVGRIVRALGEGRALLAGLACGAIAFTIYGLAPSGGWVFLGVPFGAFLGLATASGQSLMTRSVAVNEQGRLQGALASLMGLGGLIGPSIFAGAFAWGIAQPEGATLPGAAFFLAAGLLLVSALVAARAMRGQSRLEPTAL